MPATLPTEPDRWLTVGQLADTLNITQRHVRRLVAEHRIPVTRIGGRLRFNQTHIRTWLDDHTDRPDGGDHGRAA